MADKLFGRDWRLIVDAIDVSKLDFSFHVSTTKKAEPNKIELKCYQLSRDRAAQFEQAAKKAQLRNSQGVSQTVKGVNLELEAGYVGSRSNIFRGDLREIGTTWEGTDRVTTIAGHDGGRSYKWARVSRSFGPGTPVATVLRACAEALGVGQGNLADAAGVMAIPGIGRNYAHGTVIDGQASAELDAICKACGVQWSIQKGVLQFQVGGKPLQTSALRIASDTGLVGSPSPEIDASVAQPGVDAKGGATAKKDAQAIKKTHLVAFKALLIPGLYPGRKIVLDTTDYRGGYELVQVDYVGSTWSDDWTADCKAKAY